MHQTAQSINLTAIKPSSIPLILVTHQLNTKTHHQNPVICAKWGKRRSGSQRSRKLIIDSIAFVASSIKILPEPLDSLVRELLVAGGGNGGKFWVKNGFGGGDGGRNHRGEKLGFWALLLICSGLALWVVLERESEIHLVLLIVSAFAVYCLVKGWRRDVKDWVLGFSCGAALMGLMLRNNENLARWVDRIRVSSPNFVVKTMRKRRGRRWIWRN